MKKIFLSLLAFFTGSVVHAVDTIQKSLFVEHYPASKFFFKKKAAAPAQDGSQNSEPTPYILDYTGPLWTFKYSVDEPQPEEEPLNVDIDLTFGSRLIEKIFENATIQASLAEDLDVLIPALTQEITTIMKKIFNEFPSSYKGHIFSFKKLEIGKPKDFALPLSNIRAILEGLPADMHLEVSSAGLSHDEKAELNEFSYSYPRFTINHKLY